MAEYPTNISYTNKDFQSIYAELLDLVPKLTDRWNPDQSNESDPGVVLLKMCALMADKLDYNIDKNILELFPTSVTQRGNARKVYESLGYNMHWYRSATSDITVAWTGTIDSDDNPTVHTLPAFTSFTNEEGNINYTLIGELSIKEDGVPVAASSNLSYLLEGYPKSYEVNGESTITLSNLDADRRLYFQDTRVAENGIFIKGKDAAWDFNDPKGWHRVDNLESTTLGSKVFKFGVLPGNETCFIQFPQDIGDLISEGLNIQYVVSSGSAGAVKANTIISLSNDIQLSSSNSNSSGGLLNDNVRIYNASASTQGYDPESLSDAYRNYLRTVGTFNTLVTCRDYENAIYNTETAIGPVVSNTVVADRTNDIDSKNSGHYVQRLSIENGSVKEYVTGKMSAFDLKLYPLQFISSITDNGSYNNSFKTSDSAQQNARNAVAEYKSVQHDFKNLASDNPFIYKNYYGLRGKVTTVNKVSPTEAVDIREKIRLALLNRYSSRNVIIGQGVDYDDVVSTIQAADSRVKNVLLDDIGYETRLMTVGGAESVIPSSDIIKYSVLSGSTPLYDFNTDGFQYEFGQTNGKLVENIKTLTSEVQITIPVNSSYRLRENENIFLYAPAYRNEIVYSSYLTLSWSGVSDPVTLSPGSYYEIPAGVTLTITDTGTEEVKVILKQGDIITANFELNIADNISTALGSTKTLTKVGKAEVSVPKASNGRVRCYWLTNTSDNTLFKEDDTSVTLGNGEYFFYTDALQTTLSIVGSGTTITRSKSGEKWTVSRSNYQTIVSDGTSAINQIGWYEAAVGIDVTVVENQVITLGEGVKITNSSSSQVTFSNAPVDIESITYNDTTVLPTLPSSSMKWKGYSRLNVIGSPDAPYILSDTGTSGQVNSTQKLSLVTEEGSKVEPPDSISLSSCNVLFNKSFAVTGGENVDMSVLGEDGEYSYTLSAYRYINSNILADVVNDSTSRENGWITLEIPGEGTVSCSGTFLSGKSYIVPVVIMGKKGTKDGVTVIAGSTSTDVIPRISEDGVHYASFVKISTSSDVNKLDFKNTSSSPVEIKVGNIYQVADVSDITNIFPEPNTDQEWYNYTFEPVISESVSDPVDSSSFFNPYHIYNRFTIPQISTIEIGVIKTSISG